MGLGSAEVVYSIDKERTLGGVFGKLIKMMAVNDVIKNELKLIVFEHFVGEIYRLVEIPLAEVWGGKNGVDGDSIKCKYLMAFSIICWISLVSRLQGNSRQGLVLTSMR